MLAAAAEKKMRLLSFGSLKPTENRNFLPQLNRMPSFKPLPQINLADAVVRTAAAQDFSRPSSCALVLQINLADAVRRTISLSAGGKTYRLNERVAVMLVRPRG